LSAATYEGLGKRLAKLPSPICPCDEISIGKPHIAQKCKPAVEDCTVAHFGQVMSYFGAAGIVGVRFLLGRTALGPGG
jgi:hypothetical protein